MQSGKSASLFGTPRAGRNGLALRVESLAAAPRRHRYQAPSDKKSPHGAGGQGIAERGQLTTASFSRVCASDDTPIWEFQMSHCVRIRSSDAGDRRSRRPLRARPAHCARRRSGSGTVGPGPRWRRPLRWTPSGLRRIGSGRCSRWAFSFARIVARDGQLARIRSQGLYPMRPDQPVAPSAGLSVASTRR